jgi:S-(hydroxymethyl)glutathione dehydrogenase/alcohol dehydrogenase
MKAAVLYEYQKPLVVEQIELDDPKAGEVLIRTGASGVCHSDYHIVKGEWTPPLPVVLGHEAAGVVEAVGEGVTSPRVGDHVIVSFRPNCGYCYYCTIGRPVLCNGHRSPQGTMYDGTTRLHKGDQRINHMTGVSSFAEYLVASAEAAIPIRKDMPLDKAALIGCGVTTGVCAVTNCAQVPVGASVAVVATGGIGLNIIQGARIAGAARIIAVDLLDNKLELARKFGATHAINSSREDAVAAVKELSGGGVDFAFDAIGSAPTIRTIYDMVRPGGTAVIVGMAPAGVEFSIPAMQICSFEKTIKGTLYGSARPRYDFLKLVDLYMSRQLLLDELITHTWQLDQVNDAFTALGNGEVARSVIRF